MSEFYKDATRNQFPELKSPPTDKCGDDVITTIEKLQKRSDPISHPPHYTSHPSGIECIQITEHMGFNLGNAVKYIWRSDLKNSAIEDLKKAAWYIQREIEKREKELKQKEVTNVRRD